MALLLAIDLPPKAKKHIDAAIEPLRRQYPNFDWTPSANYHITLFHFGQKSDEQASGLASIVEHEVFDVPPFHMLARSCDVFQREKLLMYVNFYASKPLGDAVKHLKARLHMHLGMDFAPHLTIARYRVPAKQQYILIRKKLQDMEIEVDFAVDRLVLLKQVMNGQEVTYEVAHEIPLAPQHK